MATLTFWGGVGSVTGSKYLLENDRARVLVDCGLFQGPRELRERNWHYPAFDPKRLDAVILTHAHIDHTGYLPRLFAEGYRGPVYCSRATAELLRILLPDAARLQEEEADYRNRHSLTRHKPALPLYTEEDAKDTLRYLKPVVNSDQPTLVAAGVNATFFDAGHILGSRFVVVEVDGAGQDGAGRRILFSGDLGAYNRPILNDPAVPPACDYLLVESTYGDRLHPTADPGDELARIIRETAERGGEILIPAFAVGRSQELIYLLRELEDAGKVPILPVRLDSPMAASATEVYRARLEEYDDAFRALFPRGRDALSTHDMIIASSREESKALNRDHGPRIVISASGMMTGGRVLHHALRVLPDEKSTLVFAGYQAAGTTGRRILDGEREVKIMKQWTPVRCRVERIEGMSGHADWRGVLRWLEGVPAPPKRSFIVHGETGSAEAMRDRIVERFHWDVTIPAYGEAFELE